MDLVEGSERRREGCGMENDGREKKDDQAHQNWKDKPVLSE